MEPIELRPHHLAMILQFRDGQNCLPEESVISDFQHDISLLYGQTFAANLAEIVRVIKMGTPIQVVRGLDTICKTCDCPVYQYCSRGDYQQAEEYFDSAISKIKVKTKVVPQPDLYPGDKSKSDPDKEDEFAIKEFNLEVGKIYDLRKIKF